MTRKTWVFVFLVAGLSLVAAAGPVDLAKGEAPRGEVRSATGHPATLGPDPTVVAAQMAVDHKRLVAERASVSAVPGITVELSQQDRVEIGLAPCPECGPAELQLRKRRVGVVKPVSDIDFRGLSPQQIADGASFAGGQLRATGEGFVWTLVSEAPGAVAQRIHFDRFDVPAGAEMWVYGDSGEAFGPYTGFGHHGDGQFWSPEVYSQRVYIQLHYSGSTSPGALNGIRFRVPEVAVVARSTVVEDPAGADPSTQGVCGNASCINNNASGASQALRDAAGHMRWIAGAFLYICSGGLIANNGGSEIPYFLTANHCISRDRDARDLLVYFGYDAGCPETGVSYDGFTDGASLVKTGSSGDYTLLELNQNPPNTSGYLGWTTTNVANSNGAGLHRVHHPLGAPQSYSQHNVDTSAGTCQGIPRGAWIYSRDTNGATDGGSSGSVVANGSDQIVGQLTGACGTNTGNVCDNDNNATIDGAFAFYFGNLEQYLDPAGCSPSPEVCDDGQDNDCDGNADCDDSDCSGDPSCSGGGCTLGQPGDSCTSDGDCCSNKCKGPPSNRTCR